MNNHNILHFYGPLTEIDFIKAKLLINIDNLNKDISQEKYLHQHICINVMPTPYKKTISTSRQILTDFEQKIHASNHIDAIVGLDYDFALLKKNIKTDMKTSYEQTVFMIAHVRNHAALTDLKGRLKNEISHRVKNAITTDIPVPKPVPVSLKQNIADIIARAKHANKEKTLEEDLLDCTTILLRGEWQKLQEHFYFIERPEYLREYKQKEHHLNEKTMRIFLVLQAKKIVMNHPKENPKTEIYDTYFKFFTTLMNYDKYKDSIADGVQNLKNYAQNLKSIRQEKEILKRTDLSEDKKTLYVNLKKYITKHPEDV